jgi:hypothetical protein
MAFVNDDVETKEIPDTGLSVFIIPNSQKFSTNYFAHEAIENLRA